MSESNFDTDPNVVDSVDDIDAQVKEIDLMSDSQSECNDSSETDEDTGPLSGLVLKDNSEIYIVTLDGTPQFYVKTREDAIAKMRLLARELHSRSRSGYISEPSYSDSELHIVNYTYFFIVSYVHIEHRIRVTRVKNLVDEDDEEQVEGECKDGDSSDKSKSWF